MALSRGSYLVGEIIALRALDRNARSVILTGPDGVVFPLSTDRGNTSFRPPVAGTWTYAWSADDTGKLEVVEPEAPDKDPTFVNRVEAG